MDALRLSLIGLFTCVIAIAGLGSADTAQAQARVVVLPVGGEAAAARTHGALAIRIAEERVAAEGWLSTPAAGCANAECAAALLDGGAADWVLAIALWGARAPRVSLSLMGTAGVVLNANRSVERGAWEPAVRAAIDDAIAQARGANQTELALSGSPTGATVTVDQLPWGTLPHRAVVTRGTHTISVSAEGYVTERRTIEIGATPVELALALTAQTPATPPTPPVIVPSRAATFTQDPVHLILPVVGLASGVGLVALGTLAFPGIGHCSGLCDQDLTLSVVGWAAGATLTIASVAWLAVSLGTPTQRAVVRLSPTSLGLEASF